MTALLRPGAHRKPGLPWRYQAITLAAATAITAVFLAAAHHQQLPRTQPACVRAHSCACRYPGQGDQWRGNRLCAINWEPAQATGRSKP